MLSTAIATLLFSAAAVSAAPSLSLKLTGPEDVSDVSDLKLTAIVTNTGDSTLKLLNDPRGPLNTLPADTFAITDVTGNKPAFTGIKLKYVPSRAAEIGKEDAFTVLTPGQSVDVEHDLSKAYNFTLPGAGKYNFVANNLFHYVDSATSAAIPIYADAPASHEAGVSGKLAVARATPTLAKRETYNGCSSSEKTGLVAAAPAAQTYVANALSYAKAHTASTTRFTTWFGTYTTAHHSTIVTHYTNMNGNDYSSYTFDCTCTDSGTYAYVYPDEFGTVYLCGAFWDAPTTGTDSKGGTLVHESSHFDDNASTQDYEYGQTACKSLAKSDSAEAIENADSHEYFAENNPALS